MSSNHNYKKPSQQHSHECFVLIIAFYLFTFGCIESLLPCTGFSLVAASRGYSLVVGPRLLIAVASFIAKHGL